MNVLKNNLKIIILITILMLISGGIGVFATSTYLATQVNYKTNKNEEVKTVEDALNDLYNKNRKKSKLNIISIASLSYVARTDSSGPYYGTKTIDVKNIISNYSELTKDNFMLEVKSSQICLTGDSNTGNAGLATFTIDSYENGIVTITLSKGVRDGRTADINLELIACYISDE